jgi:serine/threonine protein kinase
MALTAGSPLGSYRVTALLGAGGMGEVYRAHDPNLGRGRCRSDVGTHIESLLPDAMQITLRYHLPEEADPCEPH